MIKEMKVDCYVCLILLIFSVVIFNNLVDEKLFILVKYMVKVILMLR